MPKASQISESKSSKASIKSAISMAELLAQTGYKIPTLKRGQEVIGKVISISRDELLIDIGAKSEGIVTGREFSSVRDQILGLAVGDSIDATVLYPENDAGQVVLSLRKHSGEKRWLELDAKRESGEEIEVVGLEANRGGLICDFWGIRGFLPSSQLTLPTGREDQPSKFSDLIGKALWVRIIEVDRTTNRLIFSRRQPEKKDITKLVKLLSKVNIGDKYQGTVTAALPFGVFVEIEAGKEGREGLEGKKSSKPSKSSESSIPFGPSKLEGLVHISEISWEKTEDPTKLFKAQDKVDVMVIAKDETTGRLNLSIKQLTHDPFLEIFGKYSKDQSVSGSVSKITPHGTFVTLESGIEGFVPSVKIPPNESWEVGKAVECIVDSIDVKARRISLVPEVREKPILYR